MIICHIITALDFGGAEKLLINTSNIHVNNHQVHIIYLKGDAKLKTLLHKNVILHKIQLGISVVANVRKLLKLINPDIIHTHLGHADFIGLIASRGLSVKKFCTMHNIWFKWNKIDDFIFSSYKLLFKTVAVECKVICISHAVEKHVQKRLGVAPKNTFMIYNGIPNLSKEYTKAQIRERNKIDNNAFVVLFVGRMRVQKSIDTLLKAIHLLKDKIQNLKLIIIGEGELELDLKSLSTNLRINDIVEFRGVIHQPEEYFALADTFVLPSVFEGLGLVILESFRAKLPVIASDVEGPKELIDSGMNGLLFEVRNYEKLAEIIYYLYKHPHERNIIGLNGYIFFKNNFEISKYADKIIELYEY